LYSALLMLRLWIGRTVVLTELLLSYLAFFCVGFTNDLLVFAIVPLSLLYVYDTIGTTCILLSYLDVPPPIKIIIVQKSQTQKDYNPSYLI
jgi:hypothetical protein